MALFMGKMVLTNNLPLAGGAVMLVHIQNGLKQNPQVFLVKACFHGQIGTDLSLIHI